MEVGNSAVVYIPLIGTYPPTFAAPYLQPPKRQNFTPRRNPVRTRGAARGFFGKQADSSTDTDRLTLAAAPALSATPIGYHLLPPFVKTFLGARRAILLHLKDDQYLG